LVAGAHVFEDQVDEVADSGVAEVGPAESSASVDGVAHAAAMALAVHIASCGQLGDDAVGASFADAELGGELPQSDIRPNRQVNEGVPVVAENRLSLGLVWMLGHDLVLYLNRHSRK
jgi:hypothetical protein